MELIKYPDPVLSKVCEEVSFPLSEEDISLCKELYSFVKNPDNKAVGLAAPQLGVAKRIFAVRVNGSSNGSCFNCVMVNPHILKKSSKTYTVSGGESCLSEPGVNIRVPRCKVILLTGYDFLRGRNISMTLCDYEAAIVQHEYDHLEGVLLTDRLS